MTSHADGYCLPEQVLADFHNLSHEEVLHLLEGLNHLYVLGTILTRVCQLTLTCRVGL
jgi:hypothetical protein